MNRILLFYSFRCVALKEYMTTDLDKYHCPRCEAMCGPSLSKALSTLCIFPNEIYILINIYLFVQ